MKINTLSLKKNDIIVISSPHRIGDKEKERIWEQFRDFGIENKVLILDNGMDIQVIAKGQLGTNVLKRWFKWTS